MILLKMQARILKKENFSGITELYAGTIGFGYRACKDPCKGGDDMKRSLTLLLASLFLVFSLTACGGNVKNNNGQNGNDQNNSTVTGDTADNNGPAENGTNGTANNGNTANGGVNNGTTNNGTANNGNGGLVDDTGDVLEDIGNGTRDVLDDAGRALTGNNGTVNRSAGSNIRSSFPHR